MTIKRSTINAILQPHQQKAVDRALAGNVLLAHAMGSGKTLTSLAIADSLNKPTTVLTPASLVNNYKKEIAKFKTGGPPIEVMSLPTAAKRNYQVPDGNTLIIDEVHALRNPRSARAKYVRQQASKAGRVVGLTGTPAYNSVENWAPLINVIANDDVFPQNSTDFRRKYIHTRTIDPGFWGRLMGIRPGEVDELANTKDLGRRLRKYVDVFDTDIEKPSRVDELVEVPLSRHQMNLYDFVESDISPWLRYKLRRNLPPSRQESLNLNAFLSGVRQVSNTPASFDIKTKDPGTKIQAASDYLAEQYRADPKFRAFVYSNYLESGVEPYAKQLDKSKIPYRIFNGSLSPQEKKEIVDLYNSGKINAILGTGSAAEGLDLKRTNLIQILEPHFNNARLEQVIGRGIRYKSHADLPPDKRRVLVQRYESITPPRLFRKPKWRTLVDEYLRTRAREKDVMIDQVKELLK